MECFFILVIENKIYKVIAWLAILSVKITDKACLPITSKREGKNSYNPTISLVHRGIKNEWSFYKNKFHSWFNLLHVILIDFSLEPSSNLF